MATKAATIIATLIFLIAHAVAQSPCYSCSDDFSVTFVHTTKYKIEDLCITNFTSFTIETWIKHSAPANGVVKYILSSYPQGIEKDEGLQGISLMIDEQGFATVAAGSGISGFRGVFLRSQTPLESQEWSHIAVTFDGLTRDMTLFVNAAFEEYATYEPDYNLPTPEQTIIGCGWDSLFLGSSDEPAFIDEVRIWSISRSQLEIEAHQSTVLIGTETGLEGYYRMEPNPDILLQSAMPPSRFIHNFAVPNYYKYVPAIEADDIQYNVDTAMLDQPYCQQPCTDCKIGWSRTSCSMTAISCFGVPADSPSVCNENGICVAQDKCVCHSFSASDNCDTQPTLLSQALYDIEEGELLAVSSAETDLGYVAAPTTTKSSLYITKQNTITEVSLTTLQELTEDTVDIQISRVIQYNDTSLVGLDLAAKKVYIKSTDIIEAQWAEVPTELSAPVDITGSPSSGVFYVLDGCSIKEFNTMSSESQTLWGQEACPFNYKAETLQSPKQIITLSDGSIVISDETDRVTIWWYIPTTNLAAIMKTGFPLATVIAPSHTQPLSAFVVTPQLVLKLHFPSGYTTLYAGKVCPSCEVSLNTFATQVIVGSIQRVVVDKRDYLYFQDTQAKKIAAIYRVDCNSISPLPVPVQNEHVPQTLQVSGIYVNGGLRLQIDDLDQTNRPKHYVVTIGGDEASSIDGCVMESNKLSTTWRQPMIARTVVNDVEKCTFRITGMFNDTQLASCMADSNTDGVAAHLKVSVDATYSEYYEDYSSQISISRQLRQLVLVARESMDHLTARLSDANEEYIHINATIMAHLVLEQSYYDRDTSTGHANLLITVGTDISVLAEPSVIEADVTSVSVTSINSVSVSDTLVAYRVSLEIVPTSCNYSGIYNLLLNFKDSETLVSVKTVDLALTLTGEDVCYKKTLTSSISGTITTVAPNQEILANHNTTLMVTVFPVDDASKQYLSLLSITKLVLCPVTVTATDCLDETTELPTVSRMAIIGPFSAIHATHWIDTVSAQEKIVNFQIQPELLPRPSRAAITLPAFVAYAAVTVDTSYPLQVRSLLSINGLTPRHQIVSRILKSSKLIKLSMNDATRTAHGRNKQLQQQNRTMTAFGIPSILVLGAVLFLVTRLRIPRNS